jgi:cyanophycin synthetase
VPPWKRIVVNGQADELAAQCLAEVGLTLQSVPDEGQWAPLRPYVSDDWGGTSEDVAGAIHPENTQLAIDAARALGLTIAGVDLMTVDISRPWHENGAIINEMNYKPQFATLNREIRVASLVQALVNDDGRIPVHLVTGEGDMLGAAQDLKRQFSSEGHKCHLTSAGFTEDGEGREMVMRLSSLFERSLALTMRSDVQELIMVGQPAELFTRGLAVDRLESAYVIDDDPERGERLLREIRARFPVQSCRRISR